MTKQEFRDLCENGLVFLDGSTGAYLQKAGMPNGVCPEKWVVENKEVLIKLQRDYIDAGSQIIYAATFTGNSRKLAEYGLEAEAEFLNKELIAISREAAQGKAYVAGNISMTGEQLKPMGTMDFEELISIYKEQIRYHYEAGADLIAIETMMSLQETRAALIAAKETCDLPVMATMTFQEDGNTLYGTNPETAVVVLQELGADAVGLNCSTGPDNMISLVENMKKYATIPIIAKPNAGIPFLDQEGCTSFDMDADDFTHHMKKLVQAGANVLGGCCGTTPEYIKKMHDACEGLSPVPPLRTKRRTVASERKTLELNHDKKTFIIGERINPTGKKQMQKELREGDLESVLNFTKEQEESGASLLDINVGMNGIDEGDVMLMAIQEVSSATSLPLCIDTSHVSVMEKALRAYPGRALMNSISLEEGKAEQLLPIAKKYGAAFILLPLTKAGLPKDLEEKKQIIHTLMEKALAMGFTREDMVVDGLVTTIGANKKAALETLETIRYCKEELGLATVIGLSNISFGLPGRPVVNSTFLTMAIQSGLTMAIGNPCNEQMMNSLYASDLLMKKESADASYIRNFQKQPEPEAKGAVVDLIYEDVVKGARKKITADVEAELQKGISASDILNKKLIPAINQVSELFEKQIYFLPQLIASAEAMKNAIAHIEPLLKEDADSEDKPVVVMATVQGDIHDIGKNLVVMMLKNYGYQVIDLGKDVPREKIVGTAIENNAKIIGLSALMTTTMQEMRHVVVHAKERGCTAKIILGGAVITQDYADEIGADGYSKDASEAVHLVERLLRD